MLRAWEIPQQYCEMIYYDVDHDPFTHNPPLETQITARMPGANKFIFLWGILSVTPHFSASCALGSRDIKMN